MSDTETALAKAQVLFDEAKKKVDKIRNATFSFGSKSSKYEDAAEQFTRAAKAFQLAKAHESAGNAFMEAASCYVLSKFGKYNASISYVNAGHSYSKDKKLTNAIPVMLKGIEILTEEGKFGTAAKYAKEVAEMFEQMSDIDNAMKHYQLAADFYETDNSIVTSSTCLLKVAHLAAEKGDYHKSIELFEKAADASTGLARYSIKEYYFKAGLLYLCLGDVVAATKEVEKWAMTKENFNGTREHKFLEQLISAVREVDIEAFKAAVGEWDQITKLDAWKTALLTKIMESIDGENSEDLT